MKWDHLWGSCSQWSYSLQSPTELFKELSIEINMTLKMFSLTLRKLMIQKLDSIRKKIKLLLIFLTKSETKFSYNIKWLLVNTTAHKKTWSTYSRSFSLWGQHSFSKSFWSILLLLWCLTPMKIAWAKLLKKVTKN